MAILLSIAEGAPSAFAVGNQTMSYTVTVQNTGAASVSLTSLDISETTRTGARIGQPVYLAAGVPVTSGYPAIAAGASASYGFQVVANGPVMPGPSPQAPGGASPAAAANYPPRSYSLLASASTLEGTATTISTGKLVAPVLTSEFPQSSGGALVFSQGFNLINLFTL